MPVYAYWSYSYNKRETICIPYAYHSGDTPYTRNPDCPHVDVRTRTAVTFIRLTHSTAVTIARTARHSSHTAFALVVFSKIHKDFGDRFCAFAEHRSAAVIEPWKIAPRSAFALRRTQITNERRIYFKLRCVYRALSSGKMLPFE